jgi:hypothetical protein
MAYGLSVKHICQKSFGTTVSIILGISKFAAQFHIKVRYVLILKTMPFGSYGGSGCRRDECIGMCQECEEEEMYEGDDYVLAEKFQKTLCTVVIA